MSIDEEIKSMHLYGDVRRIYSELHELGKTEKAPLSASELSAFDQLHYHGTQAVDYAIDQLSLTAGNSVLEIGSGIGGPARHIVGSCGAKVLALELQNDHNAVSAELTARCGLENRIRHVCGDVLKHDWDSERFDAIVSWLAVYHILQREQLLKICHEISNPGGQLYFEDLFSRAPLESVEKNELYRELFAVYLPDYKTYQREVGDAGFDIVFADDMSDDWGEFTGKRLIEYRALKERHVRVHGEQTVAGLDQFYDVVSKYFKSRKLGGIRLLARKR